MYRQFIIYAIGIFLSTSSVANNDIIEQAKSTIFPKLSSSLSIENYLWKPAQDKKWWNQGKYYFGNKWGRCTKHLWSVQGDEVTLQCELLEPLRAQNNMLYGSFFGTVTNDSFNYTTFLRFRRFSWDWGRIKKFNQIKNSKNLTNTFTHMFKGRSEKWEDSYGVWINVNKETLQQLKQAVKDNLPDKAIRNIVDNYNISAPQQDIIEYLSIPKSPFLDVNSIDFKNNLFNGGEDPAFDNNIFYGSNFQPIYKNFARKISELYKDDSNQNSTNFINAYKDWIQYKINVYNLIGNQFNAWFQMRDNITLDIRFNKTPFNQLRIKDACVTLRWADGTSKCLREKGRPEATIKQAIEPISHSGSSTKNEEYIHTFINGLKDLEELYKTGNK